MFSPHAARWHCSCNGRSQYCLQDRHGLHCINCQGNTAGRHCERCKDGFYQQVTGLSCSPCGCDPVGEKRQLHAPRWFGCPVTLELMLESPSRVHQLHLWQQGALLLSRRCHRREMQPMHRWTYWTQRLHTKVEISKGIIKITKHFITMFYRISQPFINVTNLESTFPWCESEKVVRSAAIMLVKYKTPFCRSARAEGDAEVHSSVIISSRFSWFSEGEECWMMEHICNVSFVSPTFLSFMLQYVWKSEKLQKNKTKTTKKVKAGGDATVQLFTRSSCG